MNLVDSHVDGDALMAGERRKSAADFCQEGMQRCALSPLIFQLYRWKWLRKLCIALAMRLESGEMFSLTLRRILEHYQGVEVGAYSYGECMRPGAWPEGVKVGRYVSIGPKVRVFVRDHPMDRLSTHPFFYNSRLGFVATDTITTGHLEIGHDAWLGANVIVTSKCSRIGIGAVVGAAAVVTRDVPDFAVVAGSPARVVRYRFPEAIQRRIIQSRWWERQVGELVATLGKMTTPLSGPQQHAFLVELEPDAYSQDQCRIPVD